MGSWPSGQSFDCLEKEEEENALFTSRRYTIEHPCNIFSINHILVELCFTERATFS